jgi:putative spermidine/putrescine transport system permease protein
MNMRKAGIALGLVIPLVVFDIMLFVLPIASMTGRSVHDPLVAERLPTTVRLLQEWDEAELPSKETFAALAQELTVARKERTLGPIGTRLNYEQSGLRSLLTRTADRVSQQGAVADYRSLFTTIDARWDDISTWRIIKRAGAFLTPTFYIAALDLAYDINKGVSVQPEDRRIYLASFARTLWVSALVCFVCLILAYPLAYVMASASGGAANIMMMFVLLPFWTSLLVRIAAWIAMLQDQGVLNSMMVGLKIIDDNGRLSLIYNTTGTVIVMVHVLLPFMILPIYGTMRNIPRVYMMAAKGMGAGPLISFVRVYAPMTAPGVVAGLILVFIQAVGYYITPALVGGQSGQLISNFVAFHMQTSLNWGLASALGALLLATVLATLAVFGRSVDLNRLAAR